ncbi:MAG TPA: FxsA family protein [Kofleriaceae bacterium]|nr:FxsA family protein [Kofleriaceae bacterium]
MVMVLVLVALFIIIPVVEIAVILQVGSALGVVPTVALLLGIAVVGGVVARRQGVRAIQDVRAAMLSGQKVGTRVVSAALVLVAAVLMIAPGFVTDAVGILLLAPPVRGLVARVIARRVGPRVRAQVVSPRKGDPPDIIDI